MSIFQKLGILIGLIVLALLISTVKVISLETQVIQTPVFALESTHVESTITPVLAEWGMTISLGPEKKIPVQDLTQLPDCQTSFLPKEENNRDVLIMAQGNRTISLTAGTNSSLFMGGLSILRVVAVPHQAKSHGLTAWYLGVCSVIRMVDGTRIAFYQEEYRVNEEDSERFASQVGFAVSKPGSSQFIVSGPFLTSSEMWNRSDRAVSGVGQPNAFLADRYIYLFFTNWDVGLDAIHLVRIELSSRKYEAWRGDQFHQIPAGKLAATDSTPVVYPEQGEGYAALAGVSYNTYWKQYLLTYETACGFRYRTSSDLVHWGPAQSVFSFEACRGTEKKDIIWRSYPTIVSLNAQAIGITTETATLIYACRGPNEKDHGICIRDMKFRR